ncbi:MAG: hypothetical protein KCHDKBKB_02877 [Elusimicrobia bacterium]|nr:hypothetical protein [Elusimicrobiota bacterium]
MKMWFINLSFAALFLLPAHGQSSVIPGSCSEMTPEAGPVKGLQGLNFGSPIKFWNEGDTKVCHPLIISGRGGQIWLWRYAVVDKTLYGSLCTKGEFDGQQEPGNQYGEMEIEIKKIKPNPAGNNFNPIVTGLALPGFTFLSNPSQCNHYVAYWRKGKDNYLFASVFDVKKKVLIKDQATQMQSPATDFPEHLPKPAWSENKVVFNLNYEGNKAIEFVFKKGIK